MNEKYNIEADNNNKIEVTFDDFDFDKFNVKPISDGLGFHKRDESSPLNKSKVLRSQQQSNSVQRSSSHSQVRPPYMEKNVELEAFYGNAKSPEPKETMSSEVNREERTTRGLPGIPVYDNRRLTAGVIDFLTIGLINGLTCLLMVAALDYNVLSNVALLKDNFVMVFESQLPFFGVLTLFSMFLFSISRSPGQYFARIRTVMRNADSDRVTAQAAVVRAIVLLISFAMLFLPVLIDFHSMLSDTKVIHYKES